MIKQFEDGAAAEFEPTESTIFRKNVELLGTNNEATFEDLLGCFPFGWSAGWVIAELQKKFLIVPRRPAPPRTQLGDNLTGASTGDDGSCPQPEPFPAESGAHSA